MLLGLTALFACGDNPAPEAPAPTPEPAPAAAAKTETPAPAPAPAPKLERRGKVLETKVAGTYTYARLDYCGQEAWVAGPKTELEEGKIVKMPEGIVMTDFDAAALGEKLDAIIMVEWFKMTDEAEIDCPTFEPANNVARPAKAEAEDEEPEFHGKVLETMVVGNYSYVRIDTCGTERWLAGPSSVLRVGHFVTAEEGAEQKGFESKTLGRTFDSLWFVPRYRIVPEGPECE
ncbi:MAG: hypothetical protein AAGA48_41090 [Myxococcota bacterium]